MTCVICKTGELGPGDTTVSLGRGGTTVVTENVPAEVCDNCGEAYLSAEITEQLQVTLDQALRDRVRVAVRQFKAA